MSLMTLEFAAEFSTRAILPVRGVERRPPLARRFARGEACSSLQLFSLDVILAPRPERQEEDAERWDGLA
jgi:hypothetical protein